jgi:hypothetical protein
VKRSLIPSLTIPVYVIGLGTGGAIEAGTTIPWLALAATLSVLTVSLVCLALWGLLEDA